MCLPCPRENFHTEQQQMKILELNPAKRRSADDTKYAIQVHGPAKSNSNIMLAIFNIFMKK